MKHVTLPQRLHLVSFLAAEAIFPAAQRGYGVHVPAVLPEGGATWATRLSLSPQGLSPSWESPCDATFLGGFMRTTCHCGGRGPAQAWQPARLPGEATDVFWEIKVQLLRGGQGLPLRSHTRAPGTRLGNP